MKYKISIFVIVLFIFTNYNTYSQNHPQKKSYPLDFNGKKIFNKKTGSEISLNELRHLMIDYPNIVLEPSVDKYGEIYSYSFDTSKVADIYSYQYEFLKREGKELEPFIMKSVNNEIFNSENLTDNILILHFQISFDKYYFMEKPFIFLEEFIDSIPKEIKFKSFLIIGDSQCTSPLIV